VKVERWEAIGLAGVLAVALVLRIVRLDAPLWYDEVFTLTHFVRLPLERLVADFSSLNNHVFYSVLAKASVQTFGESAWALRLPAVAYGIASLVVVWWIGREAAGRVPALLAVFLLAISYHHVWFSQNARGFTGLMFWTSAATLLLVRGLQRPSWAIACGYAACVGAGMYTHLSAIFFFAAHAVVYVAGVAIARFTGPSGPDASYPGFRDPRPLWGFVLGGAATLALHAPLVVQVARTVGRVSAGTTGSPMAEWESPLRTAQELLLSVGDLGVAAPVALLAGAALVVAGAIAIARRSPLLVAVYAVHVPLALALLWSLSFRIWPRYFFVDIGFVFLCVAAGAEAIGRQLGAGLRRRWPSAAVGNAPFAAIVVAMTLASFVLLAKNYAHPKQDFAGAVALIERERVAGDVAVSTGLAAEPMKSYFAPGWPVVANAADLQQQLAAARTVWLVTAFPSHTQKRRADVMAIVDARFDLVAKLPGTLGDGTVRVYRSRPAPAN
jgi:hypothetical protein